MEELRDTLLQAKANVINAIQNTSMFMRPETMEKDLSNALNAIDMAIADLEHQINK